MTSPRHVVARAVLTAVAVVCLVPAAIVITAAFLPTVPVIAPFGRLLLPYLPFLLGASVVPVVLAAAARRLGGRRGTGVLLAAALVVLAGAGLAFGQLWALANDHGVSFNPLRQLATEPAPSVRRFSVAFATVDGKELRAEIWQPPEVAAAGAADAGGPAVLFVHGGGFAAGGIGSRASLFQALTRDGVAVVDVEYRLAPPPRWNEAPGDVLCALGWLGSTARSLGIDPGRIVVVGESAGGNLALLAAYAAGTDRITPSCPQRAPVPAGVIAIAPTADLAGIWADRTLNPDGRTFPESYIGGTPQEYPDRYAQSSPASLIRPGLPPTLLVTGASDTIVHLDRVTPLADALRGARVDAELIVVPFADHGFDGEPGSFGDQLEAGVFRSFIADHT